MLGDGFFVIALPFQVYQLSNSPTTFSLVSSVRFVPLVLLLLLGGLVTDRIDRRRVLFGSDLLRAAVTGLIGLLAVSGALRLWQLLVLLPLSLALAGPVAAVAGVRQTLVGGGLLGAAAMALFVLVPGVQNVRPMKHVTA